MRTKRTLGPLWVSLVIFALPAAAQTPDGITPANEGMCDDLADATPGLQGLCIGMCEAQDCEATEDPVTGEVTLSPSCNNSAKKLLANYDKLKGPSDPPMPCVKVACPCWAAEDIGNIADENDKCVVYESFGFWWLYGNGDSGGREQALVSNEGGYTCVGQESNPDSFTRKKNIGDAAYSTCKKSIIDECTRRGLLP